MSAEERGCWVWHELMTTDPEAAKGFYGAVTGWTVQAFEGAPPDQPYDMWVAGRGPVGGLMLLPAEARAEGVPPHWLGYVGVEDVDATVERAAGMGATPILPGMDVPDVGRLAILRDPQGAVFGIFRPAAEAPVPDGPPEVGEVSWNELATTDRAGATDFYYALLGWNRTDAMDMGEGSLYEMYGHGDHMHGGIYVKPPEMPAPPHWLFYTLVDDLDRALDAVRASGGQVLNGPMDVPGGDRVAQCMDPQGAVFALHGKGGGSA